MKPSQQMASIGKNKQIKQPTVFLWGYYGYSNFGDDLLLQTLCAHLASQGKWRFNILSPSQYVSELVNDSVAVPKFPKNSRSRIVQNLNILFFYLTVARQNEIIIFGGGTQLYESQKNGIKPLILIYLSQWVNKVFFKRPIIHLAVGLNRPKTTIGAWLLKRILRTATKVYLRDNASYELARSLNRHSKHISRCYDLAYLRNATHKSAAAPLRVGLSIFQYYSYVEHDAVLAEKFEFFWLRFITDLLDAKENCSIYLFPLQKDRGGMDQKFQTKIIERLNDPRVCLIHYNDIGVFESEIGKMDVNIGMRLHFNIISLMNLIPTYGVAYQEKVESEFRSFGLSNSCFRLDQLELLKTAFFDMIRTGAPIGKLNISSMIEERRKTMQDVLSNLCTQLADA